MNRPEWSWCFFCWGRGTSKYHDRWLKGDDAANLTMRAQMIGTWSSQVLQFRSSKCIRSLWWHLNCRSPSCISPNMPISPKHLNILNLNQVPPTFSYEENRAPRCEWKYHLFCHQMSPYADDFSPDQWDAPDFRLQVSISTIPLRVSPIRESGRWSCALSPGRELTWLWLPGLVNIEKVVENHHG